MVNLAVLETSSRAVGKILKFAALFISRLARKKYTQRGLAISVFQMVYAMKMVSGQSTQSL